LGAPAKAKSLWRPSSLPLPYGPFASVVFVESFTHAAEKKAAAERYLGNEQNQLTRHARILEHVSLSCGKLSSTGIFGYPPEGAADAFAGVNTGIG
jgi:hypothetical protein